MLFFGGLEFIFPAIFIGLIVLGIVAIAVGRRESDPEGRRPFAIYLTSVMFVALFTVLIGGVTLVSSLSELAFVEEDSTSSSENCVTSPDGSTTDCLMQPGTFGFTNLYEEDASDAAIRDSVRYGLIILAAGAVLWWHWRLAARLWPASGTEPDRTFVAYSYLLCFVAMLAALGAAVAAAYALFQIAAPRVAASGPDASIRDQGLVTFLTSAALLAGSGWIFKLHWQRLPQRAEGDVEPTSV